MTNFNGGKKYKRQKKRNDTVKRQIRLSHDDVNEVYGVIVTVLGSCRFRINCSDGKERLGQLRAGMKKGVRIKKDDFVLVGLREYTTADDKCDILLKYNVDEYYILKKEGVMNFIEFDININEDDNETHDEENAFNFEDI